MESSIDWKIHRKLDNARTVYLTVGRGSGKTSRLLELYDNLTAAGKKVVFVKPNREKKPIDLFSVTDWDLLANRQYSDVYAIDQYIRSLKGD